MCYNNQKLLARSDFQENLNPPNPFVTLQKPTTLHYVYSKKNFKIHLIRIASIKIRCNSPPPPPLVDHRLIITSIVEPKLQDNSLIKYIKCMLPRR